MKQSGVDSLDSWIIASACCFINMMMFGMARLSGVLFVASVPRFHVSREQASFPYTLSQAVRNMSGPLVGYLGQHLGVRPVASMGCIIGAIGIGICFLAEDIKVITIFWGVIFGLGFGLGSILLPISINQYFDKKRATASGISFSGACFGSFAIPPIVELLISKYSLSGSFLILSGFVLNCLPAALLLRKPNFSTKRRDKTSLSDDERQSITNGKKVKLYSVETTVPSVDMARKNLTLLNPGLQPYDTRSKKHITDSSKNSDLPVNFERTFHDSKLTNEKSNPKLHASDLKLLNYKSTNEQQFHTSLQSSSNGNELKNSQQKNEKNINSFVIKRAKSTDSMKSLSKDNDSTYSKSYDDLFSNSAYQIDFESFKGNPKQTICPVFSSISSSVDVKTTSTLEAFNVVFDPIFILIALTNAVYSAMFVCMMTVIVDFAQDIHVEKTYQKYVLMSLSVGDLLGRLCLGWVTDDGHMTRSNFAALCFFFQGVTTTVIAFSTGFTMLMVMAALYGLSEAGLILIFPLITAEFIAEEKQTIAIPCSYFLSGPLCLTVAPLIGFFRDEVGSYDFIFYGMGIISFVCALSWLFAPCIVRCRRKR